jgi:uncharacterized protein YndB with AHSA1/START domain
MAATNRPIVVPAERVLVITRVFDAPRELVFEAWTDPKHAINWWGPRLYPATHMEMDVRPGAACFVKWPPPSASSSHLPGRKRASAASKR